MDYVYYFVMPFAWISLLPPPLIIIESLCYCTNCTLLFYSLKIEKYNWNIQSRKFESNFLMLYFKSEYNSIWSVIHFILVISCLNQCCTVSALQLEISHSDCKCKYTHLQHSRTHLMVCHAIDQSQRRSCFINVLL